MKSCLKLTPPLTPQSSSYAGTPCASGSTSPALGASPLPTPSCRKTVSFRDSQEFFEADDWDRSPAPVAPKLGYQEILELKQIMKSLPRAPQYSTYRQQFTTSSPVPSSSSAPFPVSRFATMPSATPSKWKNRDASRDVDREILPYLDSVPIQLLPLLPSSAEPSHPATPTAECSPQPHSTQSAAESIKPPITQPIPIPTPMLTPPPSLASSADTSPRPSSPVSSSVSSSLTSVSPQTPRHRMTFQIVPLLPVQEVAKPPPPPVVAAPPKPVRKFNMTFVPLLPPEELPQPPTPTQATAPDAVELTPQNETPPEHEDETSHPDDSDLDSLHSPSSDYVPFNGTRSYTSTPSLSSASDTDTESETPSGTSRPRQR
ncbi:hypothetical protein BC629DRAFT_17249 [Irpex lacteus]|nr:hypothetical protein BC629DRAFT_17249 [Irpex lacteus]